MKLHHVGMAVSSIAEHAEHYRRALGISLTSEIIDDELQQVRVAFAQVGDGVFIEFVEPLSDDSPISNLLKRGGGLYHSCYVVPDIEAAIEKVRLAGGVIVSGPMPARAFDNRRIAFVYTPGRSLVEFLEA
jgi:methylmalonyl-CoA/ethylmalonyl-CoA epimerase